MRECRIEARLTASLPTKINQLRQSRSTDRIQQLQTEAIVDLYDAVKQIQEAIWPILLVIPDVSGARDAAAANQGTTSTINKSSLRVR